MLGQSNMAGVGVCEAQDAVPGERVFKLARNMQWAPGAESFNINPWSDEAGYALELSKVAPSTRAPTQ